QAHVARIGEVTTSNPGAATHLVQQGYPVVRLEPHRYNLGTVCFVFDGAARQDMERWYETFRALRSQLEQFLSEPTPVVHPTTALEAPHHGLGQHPEHSAR